MGTKRKGTSRAARTSHTGGKVQPSGTTQAGAAPPQQTVTSNANQHRGFTDVLREISASYAAELTAQRARLDELIGDAHWLSVGSYKEALLRRMIRSRMPTAFEVSTGFIVAQHQGNRLMSNQIDILIWKASEHMPLIRDGEFVIVPPEAVYAAIEVKGRLVQSELADAFRNLERVTTLARFAQGFGPPLAPFRAVFAFARKTKEDADAGYIAWPKSILNSLWAHYKLGDTEFPWPLAERISYAQSGLPGRWALPWIDMVAILGDGFIELEEWDVNGAAVPTYGAYNADNYADLSYSALQKALALRVVAPDGLLHGRPGLASLLVREKRAMATPPYLPLEEPPSTITSIGRLSPTEVAALAGRHHRPPKAGWG